MRTGQNGRRIMVLVVATTLAIGGGGVAYAYFSSGGTGTGSAEVGTAAVRGFDVTTDGVGTSVLPGGPPEPFDIDARNVTPQPLYIGTIYLQVMTDTGTGDATTPAGVDLPGCSASWFTVTPSWPFDSLVPGDSTISSTTLGPSQPTITMPAGPIEQNACQGAGVGIAFSTTAFSP